MNLYESCRFLPSANPVLAFVAARLIHERHTKHLGVVKPYQLWQVKDSHAKQIKKKRKREEGVLGDACVCLCAGLRAHVHESDRVGVLLSAAKYPEMARLRGFCQSMNQNVTV